MAAKSQTDLTDYTDAPIMVEFCGRRITGIVRDVDMHHDAFTFDPALKISHTGDSDATITVPASNIVRADE